MKKLFWILGSMLFFRIILSFLVWHPDVRNHIDWGIRFWEYGTADFYTANVWSYTWPNQPPGTIYIYAFIRKIYEAIFFVLWQININLPVFPSGIVTYADSNLYPALLKLPSIISDIGIAVLIYKIILDLKTKTVEFDSKKAAYLGASFYLLNPVTWYNSAVWGQTDALINYFFLLSLYLIYKNKLFFGILSFAVSIYIKSSLLVFAPILGIILLSKFKLIEVLKYSLITFLLIGVLSMPFSKGNVFYWLFELYQKKVFTQQLHVITANAFNVWAFLTGIHERPEKEMLGPLSYKLWGLFAFFTVYIFMCIRAIKDKTLYSLLWVFSISAFASFMLLTNMHERYLFPFFPVFTIIAATNKKLWPLYWGISILSLLNLYNFWWTPEIPFIIELMSWGNRTTPRILGLINFILFIMLSIYYYKETFAPKKMLPSKSSKNPKFI